MKKRITELPANIITCPCGCVDGIKRPNELTRGWWKRFLRHKGAIQFRGESGHNVK